MPVNGPPKGIGSGPAPLTAGTGTPLRRAATTVAPALGAATPRMPALGGPPRRANTLPATAGARAPQGATLPPPRSAPRAPEGSTFPGLAQGPHGFPGMAPHANGQDEQFKMMAAQVESTQKTAQELGGKAIETANKAADGVKDAVSPST